MKPLMPKATAVWLIENTTLTFEQIAEFCGLHPLEVQGIADGEVATSIIGEDPVIARQLTLEEIRRCEKDAGSRLRLTEDSVKHRAMKTSQKGRYTPVARRQDKPDAVAWLVKRCPDLTSRQITKLIGTTKQTIEAIRARTHWNITNIQPRDPVLLGLCSQIDLDRELQKAQKAADKLRAEQEKLGLVVGGGAADSAGSAS